jgi:small subunit ribosomal protein S6
MRNYELTLLAKADITGPQLQELFGEVISLLQDAGALIMGQDSKGKRSLGSPIQERHEAELAVVKFSLDPQKLKDVEKNLKTKDAILRFALLLYMPRKADKHAIATPAALSAAHQEPEEQKVEIGDIDKKLEEIFKDELL